MEDWNYSINLNDLTGVEYLLFPGSFDNFRRSVLLLLTIKEDYFFEDDLAERYKNDPVVQPLLTEGVQTMEALSHLLPNRFISAGNQVLNEQTGVSATAWFDLCENYIITPEDALYDLFFTYKLRQTDLLQLDDLLNHFSENYDSSSPLNFTRFLQLTLRKHGEKLLKVEYIQTINEWLAGKEKETTLHGTIEVRTKGKPKRERDDKVTILNQEQIALFIYCLRETKIVFPEEFLNNKEAGQAFSILTGYSADTIRQNLNKSEMARIATIKNIRAVIRALGDLQIFIDGKVMPEEL
jgi:hypothetical protein